MDLNLIRKLVKLVDTSEITDLEIEESGTRIKIAKKIRGGQIISQPQFVSTSQPASQQDSNVQTEEQKISVKDEKKDNVHEIRSPIVGTFYRAPAPDADPYIQVGDTVASGSVLCIVEAMKLMNEIESDVNGKIIKILVENGKPVEYNQPLFLIESV
jgi:acetyl-CoA carboxylase biotin carboxyl carrier protein